MESCPQTLRKLLRWQVSPGPFPWILSMFFTAAARVFMAVAHTASIYSRSIYSIHLKYAFLLRKFKSRFHSLKALLASSCRISHRLKICWNTGHYLPSRVVPFPERASPAPDAYKAVTDTSYCVPSFSRLNTVLVVSPLTVTSWVSPPAAGVYVTRYCFTFPGAPLQDSFRVDVVASETLKSLGFPLTSLKKR